MPSAMVCTSGWMIVVLIENLIQLRGGRMGGTGRQVVALVSPIAIGDSVVGRKDRSNRSRIPRFAAAC